MPAPTGFQYHRPIGAVTNTVSWVDLSVSNFDFSKAKSDGSDLRVYDVDGDAVLPIWLMDYSQASRTGRLHFLASNVAHSHRLYYGNPSVAAVSNHAAVFSGGSGFDADFGDLTTISATLGYAVAVPESSGPNDPRNYRVWSLAENPTLALRRHRPRRDIHGRPRDEPGPRRRHEPAHPDRRQILHHVRPSLIGDDR